MRNYAVLSQGTHITMYLTAQVLVAIALKSGALAASNVAYVAVHGTGTPLGDPIEVGALSQSLAGASSGTGVGASFLTVGAVKSVYGHTEGAAGVTGALECRALIVCGHKWPLKMIFSCP